jgi:hypothetical protein
MAQLHQEELSVNAWVRPIDHSLGKVDAGIAALALLKNDDENPADGAPKATTPEQRSLSNTSLFHRTPLLLSDTDAVMLHLVHGSGPGRGKRFQE